LFLKRKRGGVTEVLVGVKSIAFSSNVNGDQALLGHGYLKADSSLDAAGGA
jgi:hypothetical protein